MTQAWDFVNAGILWGVKPNILLDMPIAELELSVRSSNALKNEGIRTLGELIEKSGPELFRMPNFGRVSLAEIRQILAQYGLKLKPSYLDRYPTYGGE